jgi:hypothetical protein
MLWSDANGRAKRSQLEANAMIGIAQEGFPAGARLQNTWLVFLREMPGDPTALSEDSGEIPR